jgi:hypothetical protein
MPFGKYGDINREKFDLQYGFDILQMPTPGINMR